MMSGKKAREARQKERAIMESNEEARARLDEFCATIEDQPDIVYYACSLSPEHSEECELDPTEGEAASNERIYTLTDGTKLKCMELDKWDVGISHENTCWAAAGMDRANVQHDIYAMDVTIQAMIQVFIHRLGVSQDELNEFFKPLMYQNLHNFREAVEPNLRRKRMEDLIVGGGDINNLMRGNGPLN